MRGVLAAVLGVSLLLLPRAGGPRLALLFGLFAAGDGALALAAALARRTRPLFLLGALELAAAGGVLLHPEMTLSLLVYVLGAWAMAAGLLTLLAAGSLRRDFAGTGPWLWAAGVASAVFGTGLGVFPERALPRAAGLLAAFALVTGTLLLAFALRAERADPRRPPSGAPEDSPPADR